jgi:aspartokinase-like uncharacterized kinase
MSRPIVVLKVGGSLFDWPGLPAALATLLSHHEIAAARPLLIAGGGRFSDELGRLDAIHWLGDPTAHALALHVLDFTARLLARFARPAPVRVVESLQAAARPWSEGTIPVLAPRLELARDDRDAAAALPRSWSVTGDSIAARIAVRAEARRLVLLKSVDLPADATRGVAARLGLVDPYFPEAAAPLARVSWANLRAEPASGFVDLPADARRSS